MVILVITYRLEYGWIGGTTIRSSKLACLVGVYYEVNIYW